MARPMNTEMTPGELVTRARKQVSSAMSGLKRFDTSELAQQEAIEGMETVMSWLRELEWCISEPAVTAHA